MQDDRPGPPGQAPPPPPHPPHPPGHAFPPPPQETASPLDAIIPTNPLAAVSCYLGIFALILCLAGPVLGPIAVLLGVLGLKKWKVQESAYGKTTSTIRAWIGIVTGSLATVLGIVMILMMVLSANR